MRFIYVQLINATFIALITSPVLHATPVDLDDSITSQCKGFSNSVSKAQLDAIRPMLSQRSHRLWHLFFHGLRSAWKALTPQDQALLAEIHPSFVPPHPVATNSIASVDFLFYHRLMNLMVREELIKAGLPCIDSWKDIPAIKDPVWPVTPSWKEATNPLISIGKSLLGFGSMVLLNDTQFHNANWLKKNTFAEMASALENSLHGLFHGRFAAKPDSIRPYLTIKEEPSATYNNPNYDYLIDTYGTMNNKHFWKIHSYINDVVDKWLDAKGYSSIAVNCNGKVGCYQWDTTWVGPNPKDICTCDDEDKHDHADEGEHIHKDDVLNLFYNYSGAHPESAKQLDNLLYTIDYKSAPAGNR